MRPRRSGRERLQPRHSVGNRKRINDAKTALKIEQKDAKETKKGLCCLRFLLLELSGQPSPTDSRPPALEVLHGLARFCSDDVELLVGGRPTAVALGEGQR